MALNLNSIIACVGACGFVSMAAAAPPPPMPDLSPPSDANQSVFRLQGFDTTKLADALYTFRWEGTRNIFWVTPDGVIATDPISVSAAKALRDEIRKVTDKPVKYVVYSHQHWDHILGAQIFKDEGAQIVSHKNCVAHFEELPHPDLVMPDITFDGNYELTLGGKTLELIYLGHNHGDCMIVMRPQPYPILFEVDLVTPFGVPLGRMNDYSLIPYIKSLRAIEAMDDIETIVPGHRMPTAPISAVTERRAYVEALMLAVKKEIEAGTPMNQIPDKIALPEFAHMRNYDTQIKENVRRVLTHYNMGW
ncbi:MAG: MBL fold metallo-hydrolase [Rhodobacteraceae bacterium]|nr:MBL fold metallo-hydrolase [Paracoccaceae bacterium]